MPAPGPRAADFFILLSDMPGLDAGRPRRRRQRLCRFRPRHRGHGRREEDLGPPVSPTKGEGAMKGQMLDPPIKIIKAPSG